MVMLVGMDSPSFPDNVRLGTIESRNLFSSVKVKLAMGTLSPLLPFFFLIDSVIQPQGHNLWAPPKIT